MKIKELNKSKVPIVRLEKKLEQFSDKVLFPEKLERANEVLKTVGLPTARKRVNATSNKIAKTPLRQNRA